MNNHKAVSPRLKKTLVALGVFIALIVAFAIWFDWNMLKGYIERKVTEKTGREFLIHGNLDVRLSLNPLIRAQGLTLANAEWGTEQPMVNVDAVAFRIRLLSLLKGDVVFPEVTVSHPKVILERSKDGKRNWILKKDEKESAEPPKIERLTLDEGTLTFRDPTIDTDVTVKLSTDTSAKDARESGINFNAMGRFKGMKASAQGRGGSVLSLTDENLPYPIRANVRIGTTTAAMDGTITGLAKLAAMDLKLDLSGDDFSVLYPILGIALFPSPPYHISGRLQHQKTEWSFNKFAGRVGASDLEGDVLVDTGGERPMLRGDLVSHVLDLYDLSGFIGARRAPVPEEPAAEKKHKAEAIAAQRKRVLPDQEFRLDRLRAMDADVKFSGKAIRNKELPVDNLIVHLKVDNGLMTLSPLNFGVADGQIASDISLNGRPDIPALNAKIDFKNMQLKKMFPTLDITKTSVGTIGGSAKLEGKGKSFGGVLASANGRFGLAMSGGQISNLLLEFVGLDAEEIIKFLFGGDRNVRIRCAVADFDIKKGIMNSNAFVFDTTDTQVLGEGNISLVDETMDLTLNPLPKDRSILSLRSPIHILGTFKEPKVRPDKALALRSGAAVLLGALVNPLTALIPLIETGPGEDSNCKALIASVRQVAKPPAHASR